MQYPQQPGTYIGGPGLVPDPSGRYGVAVPPGYIGLPPYGLMPGYVQPDNAGYGADAAATLTRGLERNLALGGSSQQQMMGLGGQQYAAGPQGYPPAPYQQQQRGYPSQVRAPPGMNFQQHEHQTGVGNMGPGGPGNGMFGGPPGTHRQPIGGMMPNYHGQRSPLHERPDPDYLGGPPQGARGGRGGRMGGGDLRQGAPQQQGAPRGGRKVPRGLEDNVKRTVYISYIDQQVTEESLATFFADCGTVMDCRICGDPNSAMRFAFIEFMELEGAAQALHKTGKTLGTSQLRVLPSKTAIVPVNKELMPRSHEELERCSRTVYVANIDKALEKEDVRGFFEELCGTINKIRLLGDLAHSTRIAFIEFIQAESAMAALNCSGALLGSLPLRVSPSKTPVRGDKEDREALRQQQRRRQKQRQQQQQEEEGDAAEQEAATGGNQETLAAAAAAIAAPGADADGIEAADGGLKQEEDSQAAAAAIAEGNVGQPSAGMATAAAEDESANDTEAQPLSLAAETGLLAAPAAPVAGPAAVEEAEGVEASDIAPEAVDNKAASPAEAQEPTKAEGALIDSSVAAPQEAAVTAGEAVLVTANEAAPSSDS